MNLPIPRVFAFLLIFTIPLSAASQFELDNVEGRRRSGDVPDEQIFASAKAFLQSHSRKRNWERAEMSISIARRSSRVWEVCFDDDVTVTVEPSTGRVLALGDLQYMRASKVSRPLESLAINSERDANEAARECLAQVFHGLGYRFEVVKYTPDGNGTWGSVWAEAELTHVGIPVSLPSYVELDLASGAVVMFQGPKTHRFESTEVVIGATRAVALASVAYAGMRVLGERCEFDPAKPPEKVYMKPRSLYGLAYPPTEEVVRLRLAWRVRFGHHVVEVDAATGQIVGESLGKPSG